MIKLITITNHLNESLVLDLMGPEKSGLIIRNIEGLTPVKSFINLTESLTIDGAIYNSGRLTSRNILFDLEFFDNGVEIIENIRHKTYQYFPTNKKITIEVQTDNRTGITTGYVEDNQPIIFSRNQSTRISVICPSALFYEKEKILTAFTGYTSGFSFPFQNLSLTEKIIEFGSVYVTNEKSVIYEGDESTGILLYITCLGPVTDIYIVNSSLSQSMVLKSDKLVTLTGENFKLGDQIILSTIKGEKYISLIRNGITINILNILDSNSTWFTIEPGDNLFMYSATSGTDNMHFLIEHKNIYKGL